MSGKITNIHDKFIKQILSDKELAIEFFQQYLPGSLVHAMDFDTLEPQDNSYITHQLRASYSDLIWRVTLKNQESLQITLLLEHKSKPDLKTAFQLLEYLALGYQKQLREKKKTELIIPILYYHGKQKWKFKSLEEHFAIYPDFLKKYLPSFATELVDLHQVSPKQILALKNGLLSSAILLQKYYFDPEVLHSYIHTITENMAPYLESNITEVIFVYIVNGTRIVKSDFTEAVKKLPDDMSTKMLTLHDQLILEGKLKGKEEGIAEGMEKGMEKVVQKTILNAFDAGIPLTTIRIITGESEEKINHILFQNQRIP